MIIALRRGTDWVATGIYNATDTRPDGSPRFNPASDYVVKYTLKNITGDTATYKNPVRIAAGMTSPNYYGNGQVSSSGKTTPVYCVQHDDGTIYVLDGYDPWAKMYWVDSYAWNSQTNGATIYRFAQKALYRFDNLESTDFLLQPVGYTKQMTFAAQQITDRIDYYPNPSTGAPTPFTHWYLDPNGIPIEFGGQCVFDYLSFNDVFSFSSNNMAVAAGQPTAYSIGYHTLFFQNEKATFINAAQDWSDMGNWGTVQTGPTDSPMFYSSTTLQAHPYQQATSYSYTHNMAYNPLLYPDPSTLHTVISDSSYTMFLITASDGMYLDESGNRYEFIESSIINMRNKNNILTPSLIDINTVTDWTSDIPELTQLTIPSITPPNTTISFANVPAPVYSTTNTLYKNVDYIMTGLYTPGQFLNDIVVKCKINGQIGKYKVCCANGDLSLFFIQYTNPTTGAVTNYRLDSFDPYERYYSAVTAENSSICFPQSEIVLFLSGLLPSLTGYNPYNYTNLRYFRNQYYAKQVDHKFRPIGYQKIIGNRVAVWGDIYDFWGSTDEDNPRDLQPISEQDRYRYTYTYNGNTVEYSVVAFSTDVDAQVPIEHSGELYFLDPIQLQQGKIQTQDMQYHKFFYEGETAGFYNRPACDPDVYQDNATRNNADDFGNLPWSTYGARINTSITGSAMVGNPYLDNIYSLQPSGFPLYIPTVYHTTFNRYGIVLESSLSLQKINSTTGHRSQIWRFATHSISYIANSTHMSNEHVMADTCLVMSPCGLYIGSDTNRYDYIKLVNNAGYYVPVESLTNQMSMADITAATGGFLVGKVLPGTAVTLDAAAVAALQSNAGSGTGGTGTGGTGSGSGGTTGGTDTGTGGSGSGSGTGGTGTGGTGTGGTDTGTGGSGTGGGTTGGTDTGSGTGGTGGTDTGTGGSGSGGTPTYAELQAQVIDLQSQLTAAQIAQTQALAAQQAASDAVLAAQISQDTAAINAKQAELDIANANLAQAITDVQLLQNLLQAAQIALTESQAQNIGLQNQVSGLQTQVTALQSQLTAAQVAQTQALAAQKAASDAVLAAQQTQNQALIQAKQSALDIANASLAQANANVQSLQSSLQSAQDALQTAQTQLTTAQGQNTTLQSQVTTLQSQLTAAQTAQAQANANVQSLQTSLQSAQDALQTAQTQLSTAQGQNTTLQSQVTALQSQLAAAQVAQTQALAAQKAASDAVLAAQQTQNQALIQAKQSALDSANASLAQANANVQSLQSSLQSAQDALQTTQTQLSTAQGQNTRLQSQVATLQSQLTAAQTAQAQANANVQALQNSLQTTQIQLTTAQEQNTVLQSQVTALQSQLAAAQVAQTQALAAQKAASDAVLAAQQTQNQALIQAKQSALDSANASLAQANANVQALQNSLQTTQTQLSTAQGQNTTLQSQVTALQSQLAAAQVAQTQALAAQKAASDAVLAAQQTQNQALIQAKQDALNAANASLAQANANVQSLQSSLQSAQQSLQIIQAQLGTANQTIAQRQASLDAVNQTLSQTQSTLAGTTATLTDTSATLSNLQSNVDNPSDLNIAIEGRFFNLSWDRVKSVAVFTIVVGALVAIWYFGGLGGAAISSAGGSISYSRGSY